FAILMSVLDSEYDNYDMYLEDLVGTPTPFENSNYDKNQYYIGQPQNDRIIFFVKAILDLTVLSLILLGKTKAT
ncbi:10072_t:CDS:2, partial [Ambispora leptoticha]